jgi:cyclophilin family peptidyl-prolyl cis-trans isomerase
MKPTVKYLSGLAVVALLALSACAPETPLAPTSAPAAAEPKQWSQPPEMQIDPNKQYTATLDTSKGKIIIELFAKESPVTVNNFVFLARQGFYDGVTFHRVIKDFMAQGGDPTGTGAGGPGYQFGDETDNGLAFDQPGLLAMANAGPGTNGSQFFITYAETPWLNGNHTIFGKVTSGLEVALSLAQRDPETATAPGDTIKTVTIEEK